MGGILSTISTDGLSFQQEPGLRIGPGSGNEQVVCDPTAVQLPDGRTRLYYKGGSGPGGPGRAVNQVFAAISSDGLAFQKEGLVVDAREDNDFASVPAAMRLEDGRTRLYYVSDGAYVGHGVVSRLSSNGLAFTSEATRIVGLVDPEITVLPDGRFLLVVAAIPLLPKGITAPVPQGIYALVSADGITFGSPMALIADGNIWIHPATVRTGDQTYRLYYWSPNDNPSLIRSATIRLRAGTSPAP